MAVIFLLPNYANAALQSNGGTPAEYNINDWITGIRQMQVTGGALGLSDTINATNLTSGNKNLDIHMEKNTEYGAMALLSASAYGMGSTPITDGGSTTGNKTGVVIKLNREWVAAGCTQMDVASFKNAAGRYKNIYTVTYAEKSGDAVETVGKWHGANNSMWIHGMNGAVSGLLRSNHGSLFSYYGSNANDEARIGYKNHSRAVVVVGSGV